MGYINGLKKGDKVATREAYGRGLCELGADHDFAVLDADLAEATKTCYFAKAFPDRFFDCGIAEGNMIGVAAGLAAAGKPVFASSFAMFAAGRAFEQIRNSVAYPHLNVKIAATHAGITVGEDGATHQCLEDIALMRVLPGMTVISPADAVEAVAALKAALEMTGPCYLRFGRYAVPVLHDPDTYRFEIGKGEVLRDGSDVTIVANGILVSMALTAADTLAAEGISARVINIHTVKPLEVAIPKGRLTVVTGVSGSGKTTMVLGSAVAETLAENCPVPMVRVGVRDSFGRSGKVPELLALYGLTPEALCDAARRAVAAKKTGKTERNGV